MKNLVLMVGTPASGKSTFIKEHNKDNYKVISRDAIRFSLLKDNEDYFAHENEVYNIFINTTKEELGKGNNVIADATFLNKNARIRFLRALGRSLEDTKVTAIMMKTPLDVCLERNEQREGRAYVPREAIKRMDAQKTTPSLDEGFDEIFIYIGKNCMHKKR
ncbi:MAG: ATP-binding protein [Bacilli bacterium]|nr:ATP-binding protein [Bacilli bacterium]